MNNEAIPADLLIFKSSNENGYCYLQTTSLDGESGLKVKEELVSTSKLLESLDLRQMQGKIEVDPPNENIYCTDGQIELISSKQFISAENVLLRGGVLKNTDFVFGLVIYTGKDTKVMKNIKYVTK